MNDESVFREMPKQSRSAAKVSFIEEAALELLDVDKDPLFTTNHIADRAGVSVGTLYRYFPDKGAILRKLVRREVRKAADHVTRLVDRSKARTSEDFLNELLTLRVDLFGGRTKATHMIQELVQQDADLVAEVVELRFGIVKKLHAHLRALDPDRFPDLEDTELAAVSEAFRVALLSLARGKKGRKIDAQVRMRMLLALLGAFSDDS
jgi:AcrR family transcriptional regulator